jgi:hypothetical protein
LRLFQSKHQFVLLDHHFPVFICAIFVVAILSMSLMLGWQALLRVQSHNEK